MAYESGIGVELAYAEETNRGETPVSPTMKTLRVNSKNINPSRNAVRPNEIQSHGWQVSSRHGFETIGGSISGQLGMSDFDDFLALANGNSWTAAAPSTGEASIDVTASSGEFTRSTGDYTTDGFQVGDVVQTAGFTNAGNNGFMLVTAVSASALTLVPMSPNATLTDETGSGDETVDGPAGRLPAKNVVKTWTIERRFTGLATPKYQVFRGVTPNSWSLDVQPGGGGGGGLVSFSSDLLGISGGSLSDTSLGTPSAPGTEAPFAVFDGAIIVDGKARAAVTGMNLNVSLNRDNPAQIGSKNTVDIFGGQATAQGQMTVMLSDDNVDVFNLFDGETEFVMALRFDSPDGSDYQAVYMPRMKANSGDMDPPQSGPVPITVGTEALYDTDLSAPFVWQRSNTP
jgi:hypothetical protein